MGGKICKVISLYRYPSQTQDEFEKFIENLELNLESLCQNGPNRLNWRFKCQMKKLVLL